MASASGELRTEEVREAVPKPSRVPASWLPPSCARWTEKWKTAPNQESSFHQLVLNRYIYGDFFFLHKVLGKDELRGLGA